MHSKSLPSENNLKNLQAEWFRWIILALALSSYLMGFIARFAWPPLIALAEQDLGMDMTFAGLYMSAFYIGYVATHIPAGFLADRFGVRHIITTAMLVEGISSIGMAYIGSFWPGFWLRIITGLGAGTVYAACVRSVATWFGPKERGIAFGILMLSPTAGVMVANQAATIILRFFPWQTVFTFVGCWALLMAVINFFCMKNRGKSLDGESFVNGFRFIVGNPNIIRMAIAGFCLMWIQISFISLGNMAMKTAGLSLEKAGFAMTLFGFGGILGPLVSGYLVDRSKNKKWLMISGFIALIPLVLLFDGQTSFSSFVKIASALGFVIGYLNTFLPLLVSDYSGPRWAASASGVTGCIFQMGAILGPALLGLSIDLTGSYHLVWWLMAAGPLMGMVVLIPIVEPRVVAPRNRQEDIQASSNVSGRPIPIQRCLCSYKPDGTREDSHRVEKNRTSA